MSPQTQCLGYSHHFESELTKEVNADKEAVKKLNITTISSITVKTKIEEGPIVIIGDKAMEVSNTGGIDLTPANIDVQTRSSKGKMQFRPDPAMLEQLQNAPGFEPVIINIQPLTDLRGFLGLNVSPILRDFY